MSNDSHIQICAALIGLFPPTSVEILSAKEIRWSSITFSGSRHKLCFKAMGDNGSRYFNSVAKGLRRAEFWLKGHIVADVAIVSQTANMLTLEALTVEAA
jgi:hypothetical protein